MIVWLKLLHIASLVLWCAGLLVVPMLFARRHTLDGPDLWELHRFARIVYVRIASPAAFAAIGTGTALIFAREVFSLWFALKLLAVGALTGIHVRTGFVIGRVFMPQGAYSPLQRAVMQSATVVVITGILWLVLAKPALDVSVLPDWVRQPGGLRSAFERLIPIP